MTGAVAVWVKTPGLSPVKTRLARSIGPAAAERFYQLSADAVRAVVQQTMHLLPQRLAPYWAIAEPDTPEWRGFGRVPQGEGGLGERLARVYDALLQRHAFVLFLGADAPQLAPELLARACRIAATGAFVLGPAEDGGFYLFAGSRPIPPEVWLAVPYSSSGTLRALAAGLRALGPVERLPGLFDVDTADELLRLRAEMGRGEGWLPEQRALAGWMAGVEVRGAG